MFKFKQTIHLISCSFVASLAISSAIEAYPYAYRRLILKENGKIVKIVDLISDIHIPETPAKNPKKFNFDSLLNPMLEEELKKISKPKTSSEIEHVAQNLLQQLIQKSEMGTSEKALIAELQKIGNAKNGEVIELLGESCPSARKSYNSLLETLTARFGEQFSLNIPFALVHVGTNFKHEYGKSKNKRLIYTDSDCYRNIFTQQTESSDQSNEGEDIFELLDHGDPITKKSFYELSDIIAQDLKTLHQKVNAEIYSTINALSLVLKAKLVCMADTSDPRFYETMDFELLVKIFGSGHRHIIVYAGGAHCRNLSATLTNCFNFTVTESIGTENDKMFDSWKLKWAIIRNLPLKAAWTLWKSDGISFKMNNKKNNDNEMQDIEIIVRSVLCIHHEMVNIFPPIPAKTWGTLSLYPAEFSAVA